MKSRKSSLTKFCNVVIQSDGYHQISLNIVRTVIVALVTVTIKKAAAGQVEGDVGHQRCYPYNEVARSCEIDSCFQK